MPTDSPAPGNPAPASQIAARNYAHGVLAGVAAFGAWGFLPLYLHLLVAVPPWEVLAHRIVWAMVLMLPVTLWLAPKGALKATLRAPRTLLLLACSTLLIAVNWLVFIWAVGQQHVVEVSLGYYINPLISVLLSVVILKEALSRRNAVSVALAAIGVALLIGLAGTIPWVSLTVAFTFAFYGLVRKLAGVNPLVGLLIETAMLTPLCLGYLIWQEAAGTAAFLRLGWQTDLLILGCGIVTALPLIWFGAAVVRLPLAMVGLLQYLAPTLQLLVAVVFLDERFGWERGVAFAFIWAALAVFSSGLVQHALAAWRTAHAAGGPSPEASNPESGAAAAPTR